LRERAEAAGAELRWGSRVESIAREGGGWTLALRGGDALRDDGALSVELLIGADGLHSRVRRWLGQASSAAPAVRRCGVRRHLTLAPWSDLVEVHWTDGAEAYVTPIADQAIGIAVLWSEARREGKGADPRATFDVLIDRFPWLSERLAGAAPLGADRGAAGLRQPVGGVVAGERAALVGDASGYLDAITGEGMAIAFAQAELLAAAYRAGELARYATAQRRLRRRPETITRLVLLLAAHPGLRRRALATLSRRPELFRRLLAVHAGEAPAFQPGLWARLAGGVALGR
jgi:flavin-dependent dehydrogenase